MANDNQANGRSQNMAQEHTTDTNADENAPRTSTIATSGSSTAAALSLPPKRPMLLTNYQEFQDLAYDLLEQPVATFDHRSILGALLPGLGREAMVTRQIRQFERVKEGKALLDSARIPSTHQYNLYPRGPYQLKSGSTVMDKIMADQEELEANRQKWERVQAGEDYNDVFCPPVEEQPAPHEDEVMSSRTAPSTSVAAAIENNPAVPSTNPQPPVSNDPVTSSAHAAQAGPSVLVIGNTSRTTVLDRYESVTMRKKLVSCRVITINNPYSDGVSTARAPSHYISDKTDHYRHHLAMQWMKDEGLAQPSVLYILDQLPAHWTASKAPGDRHHYIYGMAHGKRAQNHSQLYPHFRHMKLHSSTAGCPCPACTTG